MWVNWQKENRVLIVFIHGIFGSRWSTWKRLLVYLQADIINSQIHPQYDPALNGFNVYSWQYKSSLISQPPLQPDIVEDFEEWLDGVNADGHYKSILLVCHSQGGIVAKSFVLEKLRRNEGENLKIDAIITIGTPHRGPRFYINIVFLAIHLLKQIPIVKRVIPFNQFSQLASFSGLLRTLKANWNTERIATDPLPQTLAAQRHVSSFTISKRRDIFVSRRSARGFACDTEYNLHSFPPLLGWQVLQRLEHLQDLENFRGHGIKLQDLIAIEHFIKQHMPIDTVLQKIREIEASNKVFADYLETCTQPVAEAVFVVFPNIDARQLEVKTAEILNDFLYLFPQNPFRGFTWPAVVVEFARQRLGVFNGK
jgi:pimeloyl-ACP methyl ester carboxylesterase